MRRFLKAAISAVLGVVCTCLPAWAADTPIFSDDFSGSGLGDLDPFWVPSGSTVVLGAPAGWVSLQQNVTDDYVLLRSVGLQPLRSVRVLLTHRMLPGPNNFFPSLSFQLSTGGGSSLIWLRSSYSSDYCNMPGGYDKVIARVAEGCVISSIQSSQLYGKVITSEVFADFEQGVIRYDLGADGGVDFEARFQGIPGATIDEIVLSGYGWYTGHRHEIDQIEIRGEPAAVGPKLDRSASELDFGAQILGSESASKRFTVSNSGDTAATLGPSRLLGPNAEDFVVLADSCRQATLEPGASCEVDLAFLPIELAPRSATFELTLSESALTVPLALSGMGATDPAAPPPVALSLSKSTGSAGTVVTVYGRSFGASQAGGYVEFSQGPSRKRAKVESWRDSTIRAVVPQLSGGPASVVIVTRGGISQPLGFESAESCPLQVNTAFPEARSEPQLFGAFWKPSANPPRNAFAPLATQELDRSIGGDGALSDECYLGAMDAMRIASNKSFVMLGINTLANTIVNASIGSAQADSEFGNLLLKLSGDVVNKIFLDEPLGESFIRTIAVEASGFVLAKAAGDVYIKGLPSPILNLTFDGVKSVLDEDKVFSWTLSGNNTGTKYSDLVPSTSVDAVLWYNAWSRHTTALVRATCERSGAMTKKSFLVNYENTKTSAWNAVGEISTLEAKELKSQDASCP